MPRAFPQSVPVSSAVEVAASTTNDRNVYGNRLLHPLLDVNIHKNGHSVKLREANFATNRDYNLDGRYLRPNVRFDGQGSQRGPVMSDLSLHPVYLSARAAIIAPERAIPVTLYSTQKWLPRLGPERWCLIMLLRSLCIDSKRRGDGTKRVACSWRELAEKLDVHEETIASWLKHEPIPNDKPWRRIIPSDEKSEYLALFVPRLRYAYETKNGKTRRIGFLLEILMEDPVVAEDETRLEQQIELMRMQQGELGLETYRLGENVTGAASDLPKISKNRHKQENLDLRYVNQGESELPNKANPVQLGLHNRSVNPDNTDLPTGVKHNDSDLGSYVNPSNLELLDNKSEIPGKNVNELDILIQKLKHNNIKKNIRRDVFEPIINLTETLLEDNHSTGMLYKVLDILYPERVDLYLAAVRVSLDAAKTDPNVNRGAVFVRTLRDFADVARIDLGMKRGPVETIEEETFFGNPGSQSRSILPPPLAKPSAQEAIWAETQLLLRRQMTQATYDTIIQGTTLVGQRQDKYVVGVQSEMAKEWLENRLRDIVQRALSGVLGRAAVIEFVLTDEDARL
ncbi:MAG: hypothetical protein KDJ97_37365 [Anaerolineae bacterium]|nr:hypothetical protein [Anaerolineae bacterium]